MKTVSELFYEAACQVTGPFREIDVAFRHTPSLAPAVVQPATGTGGNGFKRPDIVKRLYLAKRGGSPFDARSVFKALLSCRPPSCLNRA